MPLPPDRPTVKRTASPREQSLDLAYRFPDTPFGLTLQSLKPLLGSRRRLQLRQLLPDLFDKPRALADVARLLSATDSEADFVDGSALAGFCAQIPLLGQGVPGFWTQAQRSQAGIRSNPLNRAVHVHSLSWVSFDRVSNIFMRSRTEEPCPSAFVPRLAISFS
jgi:hypothetical protein